MTGKGLNWLEMPGNDWEWQDNAGILGNGWKWLEMARKGWKWLEIAGNG